jgi:hypothetical protein
MGNFHVETRESLLRTPVLTVSLNITNDFVDKVSLPRRIERNFYFESFVLEGMSMVSAI